MTEQSWVGVQTARGRIAVGVQDIRQIVAEAVTCVQASC